MDLVLAPYRFTLAEFVRAADAQVFDHRVELIEGEVWPVVMGRWHGVTTTRVIRALPNDRFEMTQESLPAAGSLLDPDCWARSVTAQPTGSLSARLSAWDPPDVLLVVEVGDETEDQDLGIKAKLYSRAGFACYWVVTRSGVYEHTGPTPFGYEHRTLFTPGQRIPVRHAGADLAVNDVLAPE